jgi:DNA mismatch repair protein MSH2
MTKERNSFSPSSTVYSLLTSLSSTCQSFVPFRQMVRECVDFEALERHEYLIKACFDGDLTALAQEKEERTVELDRIRQKTERVLSGIKSFKLEFSSQYGYCFKVSRKVDISFLLLHLSRFANHSLSLSKDEQTLRKNSLKYTTCCTKKEGVQFQTPELSQVSNELLRINEEYQFLQGNIVREVLDVAAEYMPAVSDVNIIVTDIDLFSSLAHVFVKSTHNFVRPEVTHQGGDLILEGARHPCVELQLDGTGFIPNDVHFLR